jgi:hypothetical protein
MTCESPIDQGDSRSYNITVLLGSHRFKGHEGAGLSVEGGSAFSCLPPQTNQTRGGPQRWNGWPASASDALYRSPSFADNPHVLRKKYVMRDSGQ